MSRLSRIHGGGQRMRAARLRIVARDGLRCWRCSGAIDPTLSGLHPLGLTVGHRIPAAAGGSDGDDNLAPEHRRCNLAAGARMAAPAASIAIPIALRES